MIDSSKWSVIEAGLKCVQGKAIVNSISHEGRRGAVPRAGRARCCATAPPSSSWPSTSRARPTPIERKVAICARAYKLLTEKVGFPPEDIIFDPNIFAVATGIEEHNDYGVAFIEATRQIKQTLPLRAHLGRRLEPVVLVPRQRAGARGDALGVPLPRHPGRHGHGHRQRRPAARSTTTSRRAARARART